jgi:tetratricopeptide (TPR) repeat protein
VAICAAAAAALIPRVPIWTAPSSSSRRAFAFLARGNLKIDQKAWAEALADFNQAIGLRQDLAPAFAGRARAYLETRGSTRSPISTPRLPSVRMFRTPFPARQVYRRKGDVDHAIEDFSRAIAQHSRSRGRPIRARPAVQRQG